MAEATGSAAAARGARRGPGDLRAGVHDARRSLKRVRAVLRLLRPTLGDDVYRRENRALRDVGRALAPVRDAEVVVVTAEGLAEAVDAGWPGLLTRLRRRRDEVVRRSLTRPGCAELAGRLRSARDRVPAWLPPVLAWTDVEPGLRSTYAEGRRALRRVRAPAGDAAAHHEWRKRAKDLRHQVEILRGAWPPVLSALVAEVHRLTTHLGEANDLVVLVELLDDEPELAGPEERSRIREAARVVREREWTEAWCLGRRIWAEPPAAFTVRMARYWEGWRG